MTRTQLRMKRIGTFLKIQKIISALRNFEESFDSQSGDEGVAICKLYVKQKNLNEAMLMLEEIVFGGKTVLEVYRKNADNPVAIKLTMLVLKKSHQERFVPV